MTAVSPSAAASASTPDGPAVSSAIQRMTIGWLIACPLVFAAASAVAYRPSFDSPARVGIDLLPLVVLAGTVVALLSPTRQLSPWFHRASLAVAVGGWTILMFDNPDWWLLVFILYSLCYAAAPVTGGGPWGGVALAGLVTIVWAASLTQDDGPAWLMAIPFATYVAGSVISLTIHKVEETNSEQAKLIQQLTATREALANSERDKGALEERARMAGEIHDTLTQGFASIVLLSRASKGKGGETDEAWESVEATALENLDAARRLVKAVRPPELETASLPDAIDRQVGVSLPDEVAAHFQVVGVPRPLTGTVEVTLLRAAQEALLNVSKHADAQNVHVTLSYLDDIVALDIRDDGVGFIPGEVSDKGQLTGGQGLQALEDRARSLSGELTVEALGEGGSVVSVQLPALTA